MAAPAARPCEPWADEIAGPSDAFSDETIEEALALATELMWALSGRRFGTCTTPPLRPCRKACRGDSSGLRTWPGATVMFGWPDVPTTWLFNPVCGSHRSCGCSELSEIRLPKRPVHSVDTVMVDGVELEEGTDYRVDDWKYLVRLGGESWPVCQDVGLASTEDNTFEVTWTYGRPVPRLGVRAVKVVAAEWAKELEFGDTEECALPDAITRLTRAGIAVEIDPTEFVTRGKIGLEDADRFLAAYNPNQLMQRARVYRADAMRSHRYVDS